MSKPSEIIAQLKTQLEDYSGLSYMKPILIGSRENVTEYPALIIDRFSIKEEETVYPRQDMVLSVFLVGLVQVHDKDKQIIGDTTTKGTLDILNAIELALDSDRTIGGYAIHTRIVSVDEGIIEYPVRGVVIQIDIIYRQIKGVRT